MLTYINNNYNNQMNEEQNNFIYNVINKYRHHSDAAMKIVAYRTDPMRYILEQEMLGRKMLRIPVLYKNTSVIEDDKANKSI